MTNFVLMDAPNFIVVGLPSQTEPRPSGGIPDYVNTEFAEVLDLLGASFDEHPIAARIGYNEGGRAALRRVLERFGFERLPVTYAELYGLFAYCDRLTVISGIGMLAPGELAAWQAKSFLLLSRDRPPLLPVVKMYCSGDLDGLRALHKDTNALSDLGRTYRRLP